MLYLKKMNLGNVRCGLARLAEGSLEVKLPTIWTDRKSTGRKKKPRHGESQKREDQREKVRREKIKEGESRKRADAGARKGRKVAKDYVFPMICGSGGSKSKFAKAVGAEPHRQMTDEHLHAVLARGTCPSQNAQNTSGPEHFWKLRCRKAHAAVARSTCPSQNA